MERIRNEWMVWAFLIDFRFQNRRALKSVRKASLLQIIPKGSEIFYNMLNGLFVDIFILCLREF